MIETLLLTTTPIATFDLHRPLTNATGFLFQRGERLFLVTSRHVMVDEPSGHYPSHLEIELHLDAENVASATGFSIPLYRQGKSLWRQGSDIAGDIDVAVIELERSILPASVVLHAFTPAHLLSAAEQVEVGTSALILGFPLGFRDTLHHLPVVRQALIASSFGLRFQGHGYFLTDARTHRGISGAPVVIREASDSSLRGDLPWRLLGIHSARLDMDSRDQEVDEALGLNCAWYADILMTLTE